MEIKEISKKKFIKGDPLEIEEKIKKLRKENNKLVKGMFEFTDAGSGFLEFSYRLFKDDPLYTFKINHGEIVELPMGIVKHLNNCYKKVRMLAPEQGKKGVNYLPTSKTSRIRFTPVDFL